MKLRESTFWQDGDLSEMPGSPSPLQNAAQDEVALYSLDLVLEDQSQSGTDILLAFATSGVCPFQSSR